MPEQSGILSNLLSSNNQGGVLNNQLQQSSQFGGLNLNNLLSSNNQGDFSNLSSILNLLNLFGVGNLLNLFGMGNTQTNQTPSPQPSQGGVLNNLLSPTPTVTKTSQPQQPSQGGGLNLGSITSPLLKYITSNLSGLFQGNGLNLGNLPLGSIANSILNATGVGNPATNFMASNLGGLATQYLSNTGVFSLASQAASTGAEVPGGFGGAGPAIAALMAGQQDWTNPYSGYLQSLDAVVPILGTVLGGFAESLFGKGPGFDMGDPRDAAQTIRDIREFQNVLYLEQKYPDLDWGSLTTPIVRREGYPTAGLPTLKPESFQNILNPAYTAGLEAERAHGPYGEGDNPPTSSIQNYINAPIYPTVNGVDLGKEWADLEGQWKSPIRTWEGDHWEYGKTPEGKPIRMDLWEDLSKLGNSYDLLPDSLTKLLFTAEGGMPVYADIVSEGDTPRPYIPGTFGENTYSYKLGIPFG